MRTPTGPEASAAEPLVCICVPTYNAAATLRETLQSILAQTYHNFVLKVCDNASTDDTVLIAESFTDPRLRVYRSAVNQGAEANFTRCIQLGCGRYTAIFHADDIYEKTMVARQVAFMDDHADVGAVFTRASTIDEHGVVFGALGGSPVATGEGGVSRLNFEALLRAMLLHHNFLVCPSAMARTELYRDKIGSWGDRGFRSAADVDVWLRLAREQDIAILEEPLMRYRISAAQYSHLNRNRTERADFFLVMDHYVREPSVRDLLRAGDLRHLRWLERHDRVARAINLYGAGKVQAARDLLHGTLGTDAFAAARATRRGMVTLAAIALLRALLLTGSGGAGLARAAKRIAWR